MSVLSDLVSSLQEYFDHCLVPVFGTGTNVSAFNIVKDWGAKNPDKLINLLLAVGKWNKQLSEPGFWWGVFPSNVERGGKEELWLLVAQEGSDQPDEAMVISLLEFLVQEL